MKNCIIWKETNVKIKHKCWHAHKIKGRLHRNFVVDYGDVPVGTVINGLGHADENTGVWVNPNCLFVSNPRGRAYAARKRLMYRKGYKRTKYVHN